MASCAEFRLIFVGRSTTMTLPGSHRVHLSCSCHRSSVGVRFHRLCIRIYIYEACSSCSYRRSNNGCCYKARVRVARCDFAYSSSPLKISRFIRSEMCFADAPTSGAAFLQRVVPSSEEMGGLGVSLGYLGLVGIFSIDFHFVNTINTDIETWISCI